MHFLLALIPRLIAGIGLARKAGSIMNLIKLLTMVSLFKDVTAEVQKAGMEKRPWYLQRTVWGAVMAVVSAAAAAFLGVTIDPEHLDKLADSIPSAVTAITTAWGVILSVYGLFQKVQKQ